MAVSSERERCTRWDRGMGISRRAALGRS